MDYQTHKITVDEDKPTEKAYHIEIGFDLSLLNEADIKEYAYDALTVKAVNPLRKKGHAYLASLNGQYVFKPNKPGIRSHKSPENMEQAELQALIARCEAALKAKNPNVIIRKA